MKMILPMAAFLVLSACSMFGQKEVFITKDKPIAVSKRIPQNLLDCAIQDLSKIEVDNLTDKQVSEIILTFNKDNSNCFDDVQSIKKINNEIIKQVELQKHPQLFD